MSRIRWSLVALALAWPSETLLARGSEPQVTILFAGNHEDVGGPYWRPPGESVPLGSGAEGYYVDDSRQTESWMQIDVTVEDPDHPGDPDAIESVQLTWLGTSDRNVAPTVLGQHPFTRGAGLTWTLRTDQLFVPLSTEEGVYYSFDVVAEDEDEETATAPWMKTAPHSTPENPLETRRYVQLNCTPVDPSYKPYYLRIGDYGLINEEDHGTHDRYSHDTGPEQGHFDTGVLVPDLPSAAVEQRWCQHVLGYWFGDSICVDEFVVENIYFHNWLSSGHTDFDFAIGWAQTRTHMDYQDWYDFLEWNHDEGKSFVQYQGHPETSSDYGLLAGLLDTQDVVFTDNTINEMLIFAFQLFVKPSSIGGRKILSFVIFNVPEDSVLETLDTDGDSLDDKVELYEHFTSPFLTDTDDDGYSDDDEVENETDPNDCSDPSPLGCNGFG